MKKEIKGDNGNILIYGISSPLYSVGGHVFTDEEKAEMLKGTIETKMATIEYIDSLKDGDIVDISIGGSDSYKAVVTRKSDTIIELNHTVYIVHLS